MTQWSALQPSASRKKRFFPLLWALPLAFVVALGPLAAAGLAMCGVSGCGGGGFGVTDEGRLLVLPFLAVSGAVLALPIVLTHWHSRLAVRLAVGLGVAVTWAGLTAAWMYSSV